MKGTCAADGCDRPHHARGLCGTHYGVMKGYPSGPSATPEQNAEQSLRRGRQLTPPRSLPYRALARTCRDCGDLITTPDRLIRKDAGTLPPCHRCHIRRVLAVKKKREAVDEEFKRALRRRSDRVRARTNARTLATANRGGHQWTGPELELAAREDLTAAQVAVMIGRSMYAVKHARRKLRADPKWIPVAGLGE